MPPNLMAKLKDSLLMSLMASRNSVIVRRPLALRIKSICVPLTAVSRSLRMPKSRMAPSKPLKESFIVAAAFSDRSRFWSGV